VSAKARGPSFLPGALANAQGIGLTAEETDSLAQFKCKYSMLVRSPESANTPVCAHLRIVHEFHVSHSPWKRHMSTEKSSSEISL
jgi:hypothetical protein